MPWPCSLLRSLLTLVLMAPLLVVRDAQAMHLMQGATYGPFCLGPEGKYASDRCIAPEDNVFIKPPSDLRDPVETARKCKMKEAFPFKRGYFDVFVFEVPDPNGEWEFVTDPDFESVTYLYKFGFDPGLPCTKLAATTNSTPDYGLGERIDVTIREAGTYFLVISHLEGLDDFNGGQFSIEINPAPTNFRYALPDYEYTPAPNNDIGGGGSHAWGYPWCKQTRSQPYVSAIFDHDLPSQGDAYENGYVLAYNHDQRPPCVDDPEKPWLNYYTQGNRCFQYEGHGGWDYTTERKGLYYQEIYAPAEGDVEWVGYSNHDGCRNRRLLLGTGPLEIQIDHGDYESWYGHVSASYVQPGNHVNQGQEIALGGRTGYSDVGHSHLHFQATVETGQAGWFDEEDKFDPYGWMISHDPPPADNADPAEQHGYPPSERLILPFAADNATECIKGDCGTAFTRRIVDDSMLCSDPQHASGDCFTTNTGWSEENGRGLVASSKVPRRNLHLIHPNGTRSASSPVKWTFKGLPYAVYEVSVYVPEEWKAGLPPRAVPATRAARYTIHGADPTEHPTPPEIVLDQYEQDADFGIRRQWVTIGHYKLSGNVDISLSDAAYTGLGNWKYIEPIDTCSSPYILADAVAVNECPTWDYPPGSPNAGAGGGL